MAIVTIMLFPAATPLAGTVIDVDVPVVFVDVLLMFWTKAICAAAGELNSAADSKRISDAKKRLRRFIDDLSLNLLCAVGLSSRDCQNRTLILNECLLGNSKAENKWQNDDFAEVISTIWL